MDAFLYFVRPGPNDELRFSLRSLEIHFPDIPVFIVGDMPKWCEPDGFLQGNLWGDKPANVWGNLTLAAAWDELPENLIVMNDDMYITAPIDTIPVLYRGTLAAHVTSLRGRQDWWTMSLDVTAELLPDDALSYELHTPFPCQRSQLATTLAIEPGPNPPQWRTLYGNQWHTNPERARDVKITRPVNELTTPFASTTDVGFRLNRHLFEARLGIPS